MWERPLLAMDSTLRHYRGLRPAEAEARLLQLAKRCHEVGGEFSLLWHNTSLYGTWQEWGAMYERLLPTLAPLHDSPHPFPDTPQAAL